MNNLSGRGQLTGIINQGSGGGTSDYDNLTNKPKINNVELTGNKTTSDLNISYDDLTNKPTIRNVPETTGAELGSVLTHTASGETWLPVPSDLPPIASGDNGDVLTIDNGSLTWAPVGGGGSANYSTTEHVAGTWIDGRDVYEKTIYYASLQGRGSFLIDNTLTSNDVDFFVAQDVSYIVNNNYISGIGICLEVCINVQGVYLDNNNAPGGYPTNFTNMYVTIRYVKR